MRDECYFTLKYIADQFGKNHATIMHSLKEFPYMMQYDKRLQRSYHQILGIWEQEAGQASQRAEGRITGSFITATAPEFNQTALETSNTLNDLMAVIHNLAARKDPTGETTAHSHIPIQKPHLVG